MDVTDKDGGAGVCGVPRLAWLAPPQPVTNEEVDSPKMAESEAKRTKRVMAAHNYSHEVMIHEHDQAEIAATNLLLPKVPSVSAFRDAYKIMASSAGGGARIHASTSATKGALDRCVAIVQGAGYLTAAPGMAASLAVIPHRRDLSPYPGGRSA